MTHIFLNPLTDVHHMVIKFFYSAWLLNTVLHGDANNIAADNQMFMTLTDELS